MNSGNWRVERAPTLVYDADCGFCTTSARWLTDVGPAVAVPAQALDLTPVERDAASRAAGWLADGRIIWGAPAIAGSLVARGGVAGLAGRVMRWPVIRIVADHVYRLVAANRHRMPGATDACRLPDAPASRSGPWWAPLAFVLILAAWMVGYGMAANGGEPFPALIQPQFSHVSTGAVQTTYTATLADGTTVAVPTDVLFDPADEQRLGLSLRTFTAENIAVPESRRWLREQLDAAGIDAVGLTVIRTLIYHDGSAPRLLSRWEVSL